jgi:hypothetical protein
MLRRPSAPRLDTSERPDREWIAAVCFDRPCTWPNERAHGRRCERGQQRAGHRFGVCVDEAAIGKLAAQHLVIKGLGELTAFRFNEGPFALARERAFADAARAPGAKLVPGW